jgi:hypothetical protein
LDVGIFGIHKRGISRVFPPDWLTAQSKQICRLLGAWIATETPPNIISAFKQVKIHVVGSELHNAWKYKLMLQPRGDFMIAGCRRNRDITRRE